MNEGFDQAIEKNQFGPGRWAPVSSEFTIPDAGLNIQTNIRHDATVGTIEGM